MTLRASAATCRSLCVIAVLVLAAAAVYRDGPPTAHTGGFGENTCNRCHFGAPLNDPPGRLTVEGLPGRYASGRAYDLVVTLARPEMQAGGFQLSARFADGDAAGRQAGQLLAEGMRTAVEERADGVAYVHHTRGGTGLAEPGRARWSVRWTAPDTSGARIVVHVAANAANDDASEFGDFIYTRERVVEGR